MSKDAQLPEHVGKTLTQVVNASKEIPSSAKASAYLASLGYNSALRNKQDVVDALNDRSRDLWAMEEPPTVPSRLIQKIGYSRVRGLNISSGGSSMDQDHTSRYSSSGFQREGSNYHGRRRDYPSDFQSEGSDSGGRRPSYLSERGHGGYQRRWQSEGRGGNSFDSQDGRSSRDKRWF